MGARMISPLGGETVRLKPQEAKGAKHEEKQRLKQVTRPHRTESEAIGIKRTAQRWFYCI